MEINKELKHCNKCPYDYTKEHMDQLLDEIYDLIHREKGWDIKDWNKVKNKWLK